ncbi:helix-turn-helix domain-containing protein [Risungbinella massiliensis]|uniref:helix-turn-helix domain-containing protein n=1 Tax=Risungbinella massiliensis TaxID=1329796 RepID=UPI0005CBFBCB|nr:helix-turn-helix transcriptional regulator [Risungbinella massiliensis]
MRVKINLSEALGRKKMSQRQLSIQSGIRYPTIQALYHETAKRIEFSHLIKICEILECTPGELFEIIPDTGGGNEDGK